MRQRVPFFFSLGVGGVLMLLSQVGAIGAEPPAEARLAAALNKAETTAPKPDPYADHVGRKFSRGSARRPRIALTFDDGPHPKYTRRVVEILKSENVKATFFMLGERIELYPEAARLVDEAGFEIGTHTMTHARLTRLSEENARREIVGAQELAERTIGRRPRLFRPPYGSVNKRVADLAAADGLVLCMWSVDPRDWEAGATPGTITTDVLERAHNGAIVCLHDIKSKTVEALPGLIKALKGKGYELTTVGALLEDLSREAATAPEAPQREGSAHDTDRRPPAASRPLVIPLEDTKPSKPSADASSPDP